MSITLTEPLDFNRWMRDEISRQVLTLQDVSELTGIPESQISRWNHEHVTLTMANAIKIAAALGARIKVEKIEYDDAD